MPDTNPTTPPKAHATRENALDRLDGRGTSQSPASKLHSAINVDAKMEQDKSATDQALTKGTSSQEKRKKQ